MQNDLFLKTIETAKFDKNSFGFDCKYGNTEISFGINDSDNLIVEDFGSMRNSKWVQYEPTEMQILVMQKMIDDKIADFPRNEMESDPIKCEYDYYGVSRTDFY